MRRITALAATTVILLGACSADPTDFKRDTESFLKKDERVAVQIGVAFTKAECESPPSTKVGTTYSCVATGADGSTWDLQITVDTKTSFKVTDYKART